MATFKLSPIPRIPSPGARDFEAQIGNVLSHLPTLAAELKDIAEATLEAAVLVDAEGNATIAATGASQAALSATSAVNASNSAATSLAAIKAESTKATKAKVAAELAASQAGINALAASDNAVRAETAAVAAVEASTTTATTVATEVATEVAAQVVGGMTTEASISAAAAAESQRQVSEALAAVVAAAQDAQANALAAAENASTATTAASTANNHAQQANVKAGAALSSQQLADAAARRAADMAAAVQTLLDNLTAGPVVMVNGKFGAVQLVPGDVGAAPAAHVGATGTAHGTATTSVAGFMSAADKTKLDGVAANANNYAHPANHPPSIITQDTENRFVTDAEKTAWNSKEASGTAAAAMSVHTSAADPHGQYLPKVGGTASGLTLNDGYTEEVFAVTGTAPALSPTDGSIQTWTLAGNSTPTLGTWGSGQSMTLLIDDGTAYAINWASTGIVWKTGGGTAPVLLTTGYTALALVNVGGTVYGWLAGDA